MRFSETIYTSLERNETAHMQERVGKQKCKNHSFQYFNKSKAVSNIYLFTTELSESRHYFFSGKCIVMCHGVREDLPFVSIDSGYDI